MSKPLAYKKRYEATLLEVQYLRGIIHSIPALIECVCGRNGEDGAHSATCPKAIMHRCLQAALERSKP